MPKVSVLLPIYKTNEIHLRECIESILKQSFNDFELLIIDDCPEDNRQDIVLSYTDKRIKYYINEKNEGIANVRNRLINMAKGEYLAVCDHDDISVPSRFEEEVNLLDSREDIGVVSGFIEAFPKNIHTNNCNATPYEIKKNLTERCIVHHPASMIRKSIIVKNSLSYNINYTPAEDYMLWCQMIEYTDFYIIPKVLLKYRREGQNTSVIRSKEISSATKSIQDYVQLKYPILYLSHILTKNYKKHVRFLGIKIFTIKKLDNKKYVYLFGILKIISIKIRYLD